MSMEPLLDKIVKWAEKESDITALILTGSRARQNLVDEFSDYDVEIITDNPFAYTKNDKWLNQFGDVAVYLALDKDQPYPTRLVIYRDGTKVDFTIASEDKITEMIKNGLDGLYSKGYKVLLDKTNITNNLLQSKLKADKPRLPEESEFLATLKEFWFEAAHIPKYLIRNDLWVVKYRDWTMKEMLLRMLEWYALAQDKDVWQIGSKMKDWLPADIYGQVEEIFARFDKQDSWRALISTTDLFAKVSREVATKLEFNYPQKLEDDITGYIKKFEGKFN